MEHLIIQEEVKTRSKASKETYEGFQAVGAENIKRLDNLYLYITSISSGSIVISVTFLGNFVDKIQTVNLTGGLTNFHLLYIAWLLLFLSIFFGLSRIFRHISYSHYVSSTAYLKSLKELKEAEINLTEKYPQLLANPDDIDVEKQKRDESTVEKVRDKHFKLSRFNINMTNFFEYITRLIFVVGILLLICFAIISIEFAI